MSNRRGMSSLCYTIRNATNRAVHLVSVARRFAHPKHWARHNNLVRFFEEARLYGGSLPTSWIG